MSDQEKDQNENCHTQDSQNNLPQSLNLKDLPVEVRVIKYRLLFWTRFVLE